MKITYRPHTSHNPFCDIVEGQIDTDTMITFYKVLESGLQGCEVYIGENYNVGSKKKSRSWNYDTSTIPKKYYENWVKLKDYYNNL